RGGHNPRSNIRSLRSGSGTRTGRPAGGGVQVHRRNGEPQAGADKENDLSLPGYIAPFEGPVYRSRCQEWGFLQVRR
ncbi:unnamed protein product, partial [Ectocarpus fasciculatus]